MKKPIYILKEDDRQLIILLMEGKTYQEIADIVKCITAGGIKKRVIVLLLKTNSENVSVMIVKAARNNWDKLPGFCELDYFQCEQPHTCPLAKKLLEQERQRRLSN